MDLIHKVMNILVLPLALLTIVLVSPPYLLFQLLSFIKRSICTENVAGKVVLITGASSGIGEHLAYEYARRGARLALVARREHLLRAVADKAADMGSPDVIVIRADVSNLEDSKRFVDETVNHFGQLDHLEINFWGSVYGTRFAIPHLKKNKGKIIVIASVAASFPSPRLCFYSASKSALKSFFDTLRAEVGSAIGLTIVTPGFIETQMTNDNFLSESKMGFISIALSTGCAKAIVDSICRGDKCLTVPAWFKILSLLMALFPSLVQWCLHVLLVILPRAFHRNAQQVKRD